MANDVNLWSLDQTRKDHDEIQKHIKKEKDSWDTWSLILIKLG